MKEPVRHIAIEKLAVVEEFCLSPLCLDILLGMLYILLGMNRKRLRACRMNQKL